MSELDEVRNLTKVYDKKNMALNHMNLVIPRGRIIGLLGPNGAGKSTTFKMMCALLKPTQGKGYIMGVDVELAPGETVPYLHPVNSFRIKSRTADYGYMGIIHPEVKKATDKRFNVAVLEIDFEKLANTVAYAKKIKNVSKYQSVEIDYNIVCDKNLIYAELQKMLSKFKSKNMLGYSLVDIYQNEQALPGKKSVTLKFTLCSQDHTLSGEEIEKFRNDFVEYWTRNKLEIRG